MTDGPVNCTSTEPDAVDGIAVAMPNPEPEDATREPFDVAHTVLRLALVAVIVGALVTALGVAGFGPFAPGKAHAATTTATLA